jgi:hypothetical protein
VPTPARTSIHCAHVYKPGITHGEDKLWVRIRGKDRKDMSIPASRYAEAEWPRRFHHPRFHRVASVRSRHGITCTRLECTASSSIDTTGDPGGSGSTIPVTRKCFSLLRGFTAVHFECSSLRGFNGVDWDVTTLSLTGY